MIKLVASDIDGTLLAEGMDNLNPKIYDIIWKLKERGIIFAAASGRTFSSVQKLFAPVEQEMIFVCENGAYVRCRNYDMSSVVMNREDVVELIHYMRSLPGCHLTASAKDCMYVETEDEDFHNLLVNGYHNNLKQVKDVLAEDIEIIKTSLYRPMGAMEIADQVKAQWQDRFNVVVAGGPWIDFMDYKADKGQALAAILQTLKIQPSETMAFGDNHNDMGMLKLAGESYAVANAAQAVKEQAKHIAKSNMEDGVLEVLEQLLQ